MIIRKTENRGTSTKTVEVGEQNWAGDSFREVQQNRLEKVRKNTVMHLGRGIKTTVLGNLPDPKPRPSTEGMTRITNRGTGSRKSANKGTVI